MLKLFTSKIQAAATYILCAALALAMVYVAYLRKKEANRKLADLERDKRVAERAVVIATQTTSDVSGAAEALRGVVAKTEERKEIVRALAATDLAKIREDAAILRNISKYGGTTADAWNAFNKMKNNK